MLEQLRHTLRILTFNPGVPMPPGKPVSPFSPLAPIGPYSERASTTQQSFRSAYLSCI